MLLSSRSRLEVASLECADVSITLLGHRVGKRVQQGRSSQQSRKAGGGDGAGARREQQQEEKPKKPAPAPHVRCSAASSACWITNSASVHSCTPHASCALFGAPFATFALSVCGECITSKLPILWQPYAIDDTPMADEATTAQLSVHCVALASEFRGNPNDVSSTPRPSPTAGFPADHPADFDGCARLCFIICGNAMWSQPSPCVAGSHLARNPS